LRGVGVIAAALVLAFAVGFAVRGGGSSEPRGHSCGATDKRFIQTASANMTALGLWAEGYRSDDLDAAHVAEQARDAAKRIGYVRLRDPSLRLAQRYLDSMFQEYGQAVSLAAKETRPRRQVHAPRLWPRQLRAGSLARSAAGARQVRLRRRGVAVGA